MMMMMMLLMMMIKYDGRTAELSVKCRP